MVVISYPVSQLLTNYKIYSASLPINWSNGSDRIINLSIPIGFIMDGSKLNLSNEVMTVSNFIKPTTITIDQNGSISTITTTPDNNLNFFSIDYGSVSTKSFNVASGTTYFLYSYFYTINITFTPTIINQTNVISFYASLKYTINSSNSSNGQILPQYYGISINHNSGLKSSFSYVVYSSGSSDESGITLYKYDVIDNYNITNLQKTGYLNINKIFSSFLNINSMPKLLYSSIPTMNNQQVGYYSITNSNNNSITSNVAFNIASISIGIGIWQIIIHMDITAATSVFSSYSIGINNVSSTLPTINSENGSITGYRYNYEKITINNSFSKQYYQVIRIDTATTIYGIGHLIFPSGSVNCSTNSNIIITRIS